MTTFRKRFPIRILSMKVGVTSGGSEYKITFCSAGGVAHYPGAHAAIPEIFTITAGTVGDFFIELTRCYYEYHAKEVTKGKAEFVQAVKFDIDPAISKSKILDDKEVTLNDANVRAKGIDLKKSTFTIPANTPILDIITKVMSHSDYVYARQLDVTTKRETDPFSSFKTTTAVVYEGRDLANMVIDGSQGIVDGITNRFPMTTTYMIHQYPMWSGTHPAMPQVPNSKYFTTKKYDYFYSGQNTEIIDFKLNFDTTYYTAIQAYTAAIASTEVSQSTGKYATENDPSVVVKNKTNLAVVASAVPNVTPSSQQNVVRNVGSSMGFNTASRPTAQISADVINSIYKTLNGDMLVVDMNILGDPKLIKQDDWLYCPSPSMINSKYNQWDTISQYEFSSKYGHVRMDTGEIVVAVTIYSPYDVDTEEKNQGLMTPIPQWNRSLFSGQYTILQIENKFSGGKFEQTIQLARIINSDIAELFNIGMAPMGVNSGAVAENQVTQTNTSRK
jgi:hypothetical protein